MFKIIFGFFVLAISIFIYGCDKKNEDNGGTGPVITGQPNTDYTPGEQVTLDWIDGLYNDTSIYTDSLITFHIRLKNNTGNSIEGFTMGFRVFSYQNSAVWGTSTGEFSDAISTNMIDYLFVNTFSVTGTNADTVGFGGINIGGTGIQSGFNEHAFTIQIGPIPSSDHGGWICLDTTFYPTGGAWLWATSGGPISPDWDGPRWFRIVNPSK
ncbi:MAG: hypothetical protein ABIJ12_00390 [bacterium]